MGLVIGLHFPFYPKKQFLGEACWSHSSEELQTKTMVGAPRPQACVHYLANQYRFVLIPHGTFLPRLRFCSCALWETKIGVNVARNAHSRTFVIAVNLCGLEVGGRFEDSKRALTFRHRQKD